MEVLNFTTSVAGEVNGAVVPTIDFASLLSFSPDKESHEETKEAKRQTSQRNKSRKSHTPKTERPATAGDSVYSRGQAFLQRRDERVAVYVQNEFSFRPEINPESAKLAGDRKTRKPLYAPPSKAPPPVEEPLEPEEKPKLARLNLSEFLDRNYTKQLEMRTARHAPRPITIAKECTFRPRVNEKSAQLVADVSDYTAESRGAV